MWRRISSGVGDGLAAAASVALLAAFAAPAVAQTAEPPSAPPADWGPTAIDYSNVPYPHPVDYLELTVHGQDVRLAYMDVAPTGEPNGRTVVLFHGMNFFAAAFEPTIEALTDAGFRAIAIDRLGYGRSSKPIIPYNLHLAASNAKALLDHLGIDQAAIVGHSMGGMVATRFAFTYPETTTHVAMVNQIGLTDSRIDRPWRDPHDAHRAVLRSSYPSILRGHVRYYPEWKPEYLRWVKYQYGLTLGGDWPRMAMVRALQQQILYEDPVVYDWQHIRTRALVIGGEQDGLTRRYPELARRVAETLQNAELVLFPGVGHNPHFEIPERFHAELIRFLESDPEVAAGIQPAPPAPRQAVVRYVRYEHDGRTAFGVLEDDTVHEVVGDIFGAHGRSGRTLALDDVRLLAPVEPSKVIAVGLNYRSHLGGQEPADYPGLFAKYPTSIIGPEEPIVRPSDSRSLHYEGELVVVIGREAKNVSVEDADDYIFGVTAGNDVSERSWQAADLQWLRAKASDGFGPLGPVIARGLDYRDLRLRTLVNGEVRQEESTADLIFDVPTIVSYVSRYITLMPGDVIYTGTPGTTRAMRPGDVVEIELEGVGVLRNTVVDEGERVSS